MARFGFFDRKLKPISPARWKELSDDPGYSIIKRFRDERVHIEARWSGKLANPANYFPHLRPVFHIHLLNRTPDGKWIEDPRHGQTYHDEKQLLQDYSDFLLEWTQSTIDDNGDLLEVGNQLEEVPEAVTSQKTTSTKNLVGVSEEIASVGAW